MGLRLHDVGKLSKQNQKKTDNIWMVKRKRSDDCRQLLLPCAIDMHRRKFIYCFLFKSLHVSCLQMEFGWGLKSWAVVAYSLPGYTFVYNVCTVLMSLCSWYRALPLHRVPDISAENYLLQIKLLAFFKLLWQGVSLMLFFTTLVGPEMWHARPFLNLSMANLFEIVLIGSAMVSSHPIIIKNIYL